MDEALNELAEHVRDALPEDVLAAETRLGELVLNARRGSIVRLLTFLRDDSICAFRQLIDLCGVDYPEREERFEVVYNLLSVAQNQRIRVKVSTDLDDILRDVNRRFAKAVRRAFSGWV